MYGESEREDVNRDFVCCTLVNPKSTSNQSSKSCTVLQYPSRRARENT